MIIAFLWCFAGWDVVEEFVFDEFLLEGLDGFRGMCFEVTHRCRSRVGIRAKGVCALSDRLARLGDIVLQLCDTVAES